MAKGLRASTRKRNNAKLRSTVFGPASDARTERLSAKLQEIASQPRPDQERAMEVDDLEGKDSTGPDAGADDMQVDCQSQSKVVGSASKRKAHPSRIEKKKQARKNKNSIVFTTNKQHKKRVSSKQKS